MRQVCPLSATLHRLPQTTLQQVHTHERVQQEVQHHAIRPQRRTTNQTTTQNHRRLPTLQTRTHRPALLKGKITPI